MAGKVRPNVLTAEQAAPGQAGRARTVRAPFSFRYALAGKVLLVVILLVWPLVYKNLYVMSVMTTAGFFAILTIGVGLILGQAGQLSFGHSAFYGMGAYVAGLLAVRTPIPTFACLGIGAVIPGIVALVVGRPVLRLRYFYLALATIGLGQIFIVLVDQLRGTTGGLNGFQGIPTLSVFGLQMGSFLRQYYLVWIIAVVALLFVQRTLKYRFGRSLRAVATSEIASSTLGIRNARWKLLAFVISAVICGIAGGLFAFVTGSVSPDSFTFNAAILPIVMMLIGGGETIWGGIIGAIILTWVINGFTGVQKYSGVAYAVIMILLLLFLPMGLLGLRPQQRAWVRRLFRRDLLDGTGAPIEAAVAMSGAPAVVAEAVDAGVLATDVASPLAVADERSVADSRSRDRSDGPVLRIEGATVAFGGLVAVNNVSFAVEPGSITALMGPNGAGKTTLFNAISRQQKLSSGGIFLGECDLTKLSAADTARLGIARTFQNLRIFVNMSVLENVLVGCHRHERSGFWSGGLGLPSQRREERRSRARAVEALALVGLAELAGKHAASLPYGQQRLVEIARALASEPRILMLDEPAAGMNAAERADLVQKIARIRESGITVLLVEHDIGLVMGISDRVNVLDHGLLIAAGTPEQVKSEESVIKAYLGTKRERVDVECGPEADQTTCPASPELLRAQDVVTCYGSIQALHGVSLSVPQGKVVALLGANGAGKSTFIKTVFGHLRPTRGQVFYKDHNITGWSAERTVKRGLGHVPEGRQLFPTLSVEDNLLMGASGRRDWRKGYADDVAYVYELFPILGERGTQMAKTLSGGEQQMLAIGRALMGRPTLLLLDEPSMGLAPLAVERIFDALRRLNEQGITMLMVEQNAEMALSLADQVAVMRTGSIVLEGSASELRTDGRLQQAYLGDRRG